MGGGSWTRSSFANYVTTSTSGTATLDSLGGVTGYNNTQDIYKQITINKSLVPYNVMRECLDTEEHPNTKPVIIALDVTGSMGDAAVEAARKINIIMENLYEELTDVEFCIMGIGDFSYDRYPLQISQFESDIRIAEQMDKVYFEFGGGGNSYESYSAAWYMGARHTNLDCWKRGQKGLIITIGDEKLNPYLPVEKVKQSTGDNLQSDIDTKDLYAEVIDKYDVYHIHVNHNRGYSAYNFKNIKSSFAEVIGDQHIINCNEVTDLAETITNIVIDHYKNNMTYVASPVQIVDINGEISW